MSASAIMNLVVGECDKRGRSELRREPSINLCSISDANYEIKQTIWTQVSGYTVVENDCYSLDVLGGFRLANVD